MNEPLDLDETHAWLDARKSLETAKMGLKLLTEVRELRAQVKHWEDKETRCGHNCAATEMEEREACASLAEAHDSSLARLGGGHYDKDRRILAERGREIAAAIRARGRAFAISPRLGTVIGADTEDREP